MKFKVLDGESAMMLTGEPYECYSCGKELEAGDKVYEDKDQDLWCETCGEIAKQSGHK